MLSPTNELLCVQLNNAGATSLLRRDHQMSIKILLRALKIVNFMLRMNKLLNARHRRRCDSGERSCMNSLSSSSSKVRRRTEQFGALQSKSYHLAAVAKSTSIVPGNDSYIFNEPIFIDINDTIHSKDSKSCLFQVSIVIMFNLALSHHLLGLQSQTEEQKKLNLKKAKSLYKLSCNIQIQEDIHLNEMHMMAHLNNLGQLHSLEGNERLAKKCFDRVLVHILLSVDANRLQGNEEPTSSYEGFFYNVMKNILDDPMSAPAA